MKSEQIRDSRSDKIDASPEDDENSACEKWEYMPVFFKTDNTRTWLDVPEGYYKASRLLIQGVASGKFSEDVEGVAAIFLFRHYLELSLKRIIIEGRWLKSTDENTRKEDVAELKPTHNLGGLWVKVISDAMPKIGQDQWNTYDVEFVRKCVFEFDLADSNGETHRYPQEGAENYLMSFQQLAANMVHVHDVLETIIGWLVETYGLNAEWSSELNSF